MSLLPRAWCLVYLELLNSRTRLTPGTNTESLPIGISYTPTAVENDTGQITITFQGGVTETVNLTGSGATSTYTYTYLNGTGGTPTPVKPGDTITLPAVTGVNLWNNPGQQQCDRYGHQLR